MGSDLVVITGASGFVGRRFGPLAAAHFPGADLLCYAGQENSDYERTGKNALTQNKIPFAEADFVSGRGLMNLKKQPRFVFHLAANSATWQRDHRCNDVGTRNLIGSLKGLAQGSHVLFTSSIAVVDMRRNYSAP